MSWNGSIQPCDTKFDELGYPKDESLVQLFDRVGVYGGHTAGDKVLSAYEELVSDCKYEPGRGF